MREPNIAKNNCLLVSQKERNVFQFSDNEEGGVEEELFEVSWRTRFSTKGVIVSPLVKGELLFSSVEHVKLIHVH